MDSAKNKTGCLICGGDIFYQDAAAERVCFYCKQSFRAYSVCKDNHYVCDGCHSESAAGIITKYCLSSDGVNPILSAQDLMRHPAIKMHGPEHHFLIPAVLLASYYNLTGNRSELAAKLAEAQKRAKNVLGGFCGFYGSCGAAVGVGIFMSIATGATPLSKNEWQLTNLATSEALREIALGGGPRCCKRNTFIAIDAAARFLEEHLHVRLEPANDIKCTFDFLNMECKGNECKFYSQS